MASVWVIRAGEGAVKLDEMRRAGLIAVRYRSVGDATTMTAAQIEAALRGEGREAGAPQLRARIQMFANRVAVGDLVITPNTAEREVWFSRVTGPYQHSPHPPVDGYFHWRTVDWLGAIDRDTALPDDRLVELNQQWTIFELHDAGFWEGRASAGGFLTGAEAIATRAARRPRANSPKPQPKTRMVCGGVCGLTWEASVLVDGLCPDCR